MYTVFKIYIVFIYVGIFSIISSCSIFDRRHESIVLDKSIEQVVAPPKDISIGGVTPMAKIGGGSYLPLYGNDSLVFIKGFLIDVYPVSNSDYLQFVKVNKRWRKSLIKKIFADGNYLLKWENDSTLEKGMNMKSPVTNVSWYAAKAYCESLGKRLPTVDEWEYVAMADKKQPDARKATSYNQYILDWYEKPKTYTDTIGNTFKNYWGVYDLHGLVWEWTSDFNSVLITGESRNDVTTDNNLFCGSGSLNSSDLMNYAAFMRFAFRGSIKADYSVQNLGFRCAKEVIK